MARVFTINTSNFLSLGQDVISPVIAGAAQVSVSAWVYYNSITATANANRLLTVCDGSNASGLVMTTDASSHFRVGARSVTPGDAFQVGDGTSTLPTGRFIHVGGMVDFANDKIYVYVHGQLETTASVAFTNTTYTNGTHGVDSDCVGGNLQAGTAAAQLDGMLAEVTVWAFGLNQKNFGDLALGASPGYVGHPCFYMPMTGQYPIEIDISRRTTAVGTITGSIPIAPYHPLAFPVYRNRLSRDRRFPSYGTTAWN